MKLALLSNENSVLATTSQPGKCAGCDSMRSFFVSRGGRVVCVHCDGAEQEAQCTRAGCNRPLVAGVNSDFCSARCEGEFREEGRAP